MQYVSSTYEILAFRCMNESIGERHSEWAIKMLKAGFETDHLASLVILEKPINQFEAKILLDDVLKELDLNYSDCQKILFEYTSYLIQCFLNKEILLIKMLNQIKKLCLFLDYDKELSSFYELYHAKIDLESYGSQHYYQGANIQNIDTLIFDECLEWLEKYPIN